MRRISILLILSLAITLGVISTAESATKKYPSRIISLSPSATEDLFALGAGKQVIAVDDNSNFPENVPQTKLSSFSPNVEAIAKYRPDLVILQSTATNSSQVAAQLSKLKIPVFIEITPVDLDGVYKEITDLGNLVGRLGKAKLLIASIRVARLGAIVSAKKFSGITFFHELDNTLFSATSSTFIGRIYADFNLINIADKAAKADDVGYPKLQNEYVIGANPQVIFLSDAQYGETEASLSTRPGWSAISAVKNHHVIELPADISSRWGPRIANLYRFIADSIKPIN